MSTQKKRCTGTNANTSSGKKLPRSNPSNAASRKSSNEGGYNTFEDKSRSLLCHPFGPPLATAFHGQDLPTSLRILVGHYPENIATQVRGNHILLQVYKNKMTETELTTLLTAKIKEIFGGKFSVMHQTNVTDEFDSTQPGGRTDLVFHDLNNNEFTPVALLEFGRASGDWWKKFHQGVMYLDLMRNASQKNMSFQKPMLLVIVTLDDSGAFFRIGVFLCTRKDQQDKDDDFRVSLIWQQQDNDLGSASKSFGSLLRISALFQAWRANHESRKELLDYEYLSSNCCRIGNRVSDKSTAFSFKHVLYLFIKCFFLACFCCCVTR
jgi:hypothetical protein